MPGAQYCSVYGCSNNTRSTPQFTFFNIPKNEDRRQAWANLIDREDLLTRPIRAYVCSSHFLTSDIKNKRLKNDALPSLNLPGQRSFTMQSTSSYEGKSLVIEIEPLHVTNDGLEAKMSDSNPESGPLFIDVASGAEQYPLSVVVSDPPTNSEPLVANVKVEPDCKTERATSPLASYLDIQPRRIRCTECNKFSAENEEKMLRHIRKVHRGENPFQCYMCDYSTYNKSLFEEHVRIHQGIKPFKCSHCPYRSASKKNTKKHELIHRPDNPHKCSQCGFIARHIKSLQCHINTEHANRNWGENTQVKLGKNSKCGYCKRMFEDLESHEKHRQQCNECQKICCNKSLLKRHMASAHGEKNRLSKADFVCAICKWSSNVKPRILLHLIHHPNQVIDSAIVDVRVLKECGIVGPGW